MNYLKPHKAFDCCNLQDKGARGGIIYEPEKRMGGEHENKIVSLKNPWVGFADFIRTHLLLAVGVAAFLGLVYGGQAFSNYFYIDKEVLVNNPGKK